MGLKVATFITTNQYGIQTPVYLTWGGIDVRWNQTNYIRFNAFASETDSEINEPFEVYHLPVDQAVILNMLGTEGFVGLVISDESWSLAQTTPFIPDYSTIDQENGRRVRTLKSLTDLGATIIDIGNTTLMK